MIQAHNPMIIGDTKQVAVTFENGNKLVSLSLDNSGGRMEMLSRADVRLLIRESHRENHISTGKFKDVTGEVFGVDTEVVVSADLNTFETAMNWLRRSDWGFDNEFVK